MFFDSSPYIAAFLSFCGLWSVSNFSLALGKEKQRIMMFNMYLKLFSMEYGVVSFWVARLLGHGSTGL